MTAHFNLMRVPQLRGYLRDRGISVTGYGKLQLARLAEVAEEIGLPTDVDLQNCTTISDKVQALDLGFTDPFSVSGFSSDLADIPCLSIYDIFNFLIERRSDFDRKKIKAYKSYDDYRLFNDGYVESVQFNPLPNNDTYCMFSCQVKPTQKDKTYLNKKYYDLWIIMEKTGDITLAYCQCPGGADGACRHIAASLFEIEAFEPQSCTDGENKWQRRPRQHDEPVPIQSLKIHTARYRMSVSETDREHPYCDTFDPRQAIHMNGPGEEDMKKFTQQLLQINPNIQVLETLMEPMDIDHSETNEPLTTMDHQCLELSMKLKADQFIMERCTSSSTTNTPQDFINSLNFSQEDIEYIENSTRGQSENGNWFEMRKGLITASNFSRVTRHMQSGRRAPSLLQELTDGDSSQECRSEALDWGRKKEKVAKSLYKKALHKVHKRLTIKETGLVVSAEHPFLACSPDGVVSCKCKASGHEPRLIEVKCPYNSRTISAKQAALVKGCVEANGCLSLTEQSEFYHQVQGQLGICGHTLCHLVIYTTKGIEVIEVKFNPEFYKSMTSYLSDYFKTEMVPALLHLDVDNEQDID